MAEFPFWANRERDLGGRVFRQSNRMVPPNDWVYRFPLWEGNLLAIYEGDEIPAGPVKLDNGATSVIKRGQLVRFWFNYLSEDSFGDTVVAFKIRHAYRRGIAPETVPFYFATYVIKCSISYNISTSVYDILRLSINNKQYSVNQEEITGNMMYFYRLMQTVVNEFIYLDKSNPTLNMLQLDVEAFSKSSYRRNNFLFFLSNMEYYLKLEREEKYAERQAMKKPRMTIELETIERRAGITEITVNSERPAPSEEPKYDRLKYPVKVDPLDNIEISTKSSKTSGKAYIVNEAWFIVTWPKEHAHAFWVCRIIDKDYFLEKLDGNKYLYRRSAANDEHPIWRFYHTPGGYEKLRELCGF